MEKFNYSSKMQAPKIEKIVLNIGVGDAVSNSKFLDDAVNELTLITVQKPVVTRAKNSYILSPRKVTLQPIAWPSLNLKPAIDFLALVTTGFWPVINVNSLTASSNNFELDTEALLAKVEEYKKELFGLRFQQATGQLENTARIRQVRKTIARIKTVIRERELNQ